MTTEEVNFAMTNRFPVLLARGGTVLSKPLAVIGVSKRIRTMFEVERGADPFYIDVILSDVSGRSEVHAFPEQLDPEEPERFAGALAWYREKKKAGDSVGAAEVEQRAEKMP